MSERPKATHEPIDYISKLSKPKKWILLVQQTVTDHYKHYVKRWKMVPIEDRMKLDHITEDELQSITATFGTLPFLMRSIGQGIINIREQMNLEIPPFIDTHLNYGMEIQNKEGEMIQTHSLNNNLTFLELFENRLIKLSERLGL